MPPDHAYKSYLLRLWRSGSAEQPVWRASLEEPHTGQRLHFATLDRLCAFLQDQTEAMPEGHSTSRSSDDVESGQGTS